MSIFRRVSFLGFALVSLVVLAACGGDGDGGDGTFELPPPGEYSFEVTGTMEIEFFEEAVSAAPVAIQGSQTVDYQGSLRISLGEDGSFTLLDKDGLILKVEEAPEGPLTLTDNGGSGGTISEDGVTMELNVLAELRDGVTTTHEQPIILEGPDNPFSDEGATLTPPPDAEPVRFMPIEGYRELNRAILLMFLNELWMGEEFEGTDGQGQDGADEDPMSVLEFSDPQDDATDCATGETVDDPAVDIQSVSVRQVDTRVEVEVSMGQSPMMSLEDYYSFAILVYLFGWDYLVEFHAGERRQGQTDSSGNVIPGTEDDVTVTDDAVTFVIRDVDSIPEGSELEVEAFHMENQGSSVNCDTFMEVLSPN
ncbi:MAG: hypothetical protein IIA91_04760 [Chloroflexi bacterium]|nr:hypothetical protein [Chloroflexota bacterium]